MKKIIRKVLLEALGVPEGILESGERLYQLIDEKLKRLPTDISEKKTFHLKTDVKISDLSISKIVLHVEFTQVDELNEVQFYSMAFLNRSSLNGEKFHLINIVNPEVMEMMISFAGPADTTKKDILQYFKKDKANLTSSITHELGHAYNYFKTKTSSIKDTAKYIGYSKTSFPFQPIQDFIHFLYFIHSIENIVRPIEVASMMRSGEIDKEGFYDFIINNKTYKMLKSINSFSYEKMRDDLENDSSRVVHFLRQIGVKMKFDNSSDAVDELLRIVYINLMNNTIGTARDMLSQNPLEDILGFVGNKEKFFKKLVNTFSKHEESPKEFFKSEEKHMKIISQKMMKKLIRLYDMAKINPKSIENWELHHKINRTGEQFETELKYKRTFN